MFSKKKTEVHASVCAVLEGARRIAVNTIRDRDPEAPKIAYWETVSATLKATFETKTDMHRCRGFGKSYLVKGKLRAGTNLFNVSVLIHVVASGSLDEHRVWRPYDTSDFSLGLISLIRFVRIGKAHWPDPTKNEGHRDGFGLPFHDPLVEIDGF